MWMGNKNVRIAVVGFIKGRDGITGVTDWFEKEGLASEDEYDMVLDLSEKGKMLVKLSNCTGSIYVNENDKKDLLIQMIQLLVEVQTVDVDSLDWIKVMTPACLFRSTVVDVRYCVEWIKECLKQKCEKMLLATTNENLSLLELSEHLVNPLDKADLAEYIYWCNRFK